MAKKEYLRYNNLRILRWKGNIPYYYTPRGFTPYIAEALVFTSVDKAENMAAQTGGMVVEGGIHNAQAAITEIQQAERRRIKAL